MTNAAVPVESIYASCPRRNADNNLECDCSESLQDPRTCWWYRTYCDPDNANVIQIPGFGHIELLDEDEGAADTSIAPLASRTDVVPGPSMFQLSDIRQVLTGLREWVVRHVPRV